MMMNHSATPLMHALIVVSSVGCSAQDSVSWSGEDAGSIVRFTVDRSQSMLQARHPETQETLEANLPGELFDSPVRIQVVSQDEASLDTPLDALAADWSAQLSEDLDWMLANFATSDQSDIQSMMADESIRNRNREILQRYGTPQVVGWVSIGEFVVLIEKFTDGRHMVPTFVNESGQWKRTNALSDDLTYDIVFSAVDRGRFDAQERAD